jgi:Peptidase M15
VASRSDLFKLAGRTIVPMMRLPALLFMVAPSVAAAQPPAWVPGMPWQPTAPYVTAGQDEPGYRNWYAASPAHPTEVRSFNAYLVTYGVGGIVPTWQLLRTASDWQKCGSPPFEVPPQDEWPNVVQALRYVRDQVVPRIGPVEPVSVYRNPVLNQCAGGAQESAHRFMQAVDMVPLRPITRAALIDQLCAIHARSGEGYGVGLGFYVGLRFHVDSRKFRTWGVNDQGGIACARSYELAHAADVIATPEPAAPLQDPAPPKP